MLNGSADVSISAVSGDSASSSYSAFDSIYDIFGDTLEDDPSSNTSIENIFQKIVRFLIHYESESMHSIACESCLTRDIIWICNHWTENYSDEDYASIMDEEVSVFKYLGWVFSRWLLVSKDFLDPLKWSFATNSPNKKCASTKMSLVIANVLNPLSFKRFIFLSTTAQMINENIQYRLLAFIIMFVLPTFIVTISYISLIRKVGKNLFRSRSNLGFGTALRVQLWSSMGSWNDQ